MIDIPPRYNPEVEGRLYKFWEDEGFFQPQAPGGDRKPFCIVIPPPNITGSLHMGHALNNAIQDCLIRWKRMCGYSALWMPGVDHAGIATQNVVEKGLSREGETRDGLGREEFVKRVWRWKEEYGDEIVQQLRLLGSSCDWGRLRFTMDEKYSLAVREAFVRLYEDGLIYRGNRIINWCPRCRTALSDIEVEHEEVEGRFYYVKYLLKQGSEIIVATTRPETMLGDTAVAVHPDDERYREFIGKTVILPLVGREIEIVADERVDPSFGTGAVKVTPAHDPDDFEIGRTHELAEITVIGPDGKMTEDAGRFSGQDRYDCRQNVLAELKENGYLLKTEKHTHSVGHCYRCNSAVEPLVSLQWFVRMKELAQPAIKAVEDGEIKFVPHRWTGVYLDWMKNIDDWCISRQIWWGHRIPVWYCGDCQAVTVGRIAPEKCGECSSSDMTQDEDVLDTWFSSALWPFAGLGWPERTEELDYFYPTSVLVTGYEIICLWVARMIMMGVKLVGHNPFPDVYIHGIVRDSKGKKMSKSLGNVIDPREIIGSYGTDALRMTLLTTLGGQDIYLGNEKLEGMRNFANKLWNAGRFILINMDENGSADAEMPDFTNELALDDRWILTELQRLIEEVDKNLTNYRFADAAQVLYDFTWHKFCDWYLELVKPRLRQDAEKDSARQVLLLVWERLLRLLHPFMPFITEELWQLLPSESAGGPTPGSGQRAKSIMVSAWPRVCEELMDAEAVRLAERKYDVVRTGRQLRTEKGIPPGQKMRFIIKPVDEEEGCVLNDGISGVELLLGASELRIDTSAEVPEKSLSGVSGSGTCIYMIADEVDVKSENERLGRELEKIEMGIKLCEGRLSNSQFIEKAPDDIIEKEKLKKREFEERRERLMSHLASL